MQGTFIGSRDQAMSKLQGALAARRDQSAAALERIYTEIPEDQIATGGAFAFYPAIEGAPSLVAHVGDKRFSVHPHARRQLAERAGMPTQYAEKLLAGDDWERRMLGDILNTSYHEGGGRYLVRSYREQIRGVMSDRFRRLDCRPIADALVTAARDVGAVCYDVIATDVRVQIKAVIPEAVEILPGEFVAFGLAWSNSDYAAGANDVRAFINRLWCLNGCTAEDLLRQVHLGGRLPDSIDFTQQTYELDTATAVSAMRDLVTGSLSAEGRQRTVSIVQAAAEKEADWTGVKGKLSKLLTKDELRRVDEAYKGPDVVNLPPGRTTWRASNAVSWLANADDVSAERRLELERVAGSLLPRA